MEGVTESETVQVPPAGQPLAPIASIGTSAPSTRKRSYLRRDNVEVMDVWSYCGKKSGKEYTLFRCKRVTQPDGRFVVFALEPEWKGVTPLKGNLYNLEATANSNGPWHFCSTLELVIVREKTVPVPPPRTHHVTDVPDTQKLAFEKKLAKVPEDRREILKHIALKGPDGTDLQVMEDELGRPKHTFSGRVSELLHEDHLIIDTGRRAEHHGQYFRVVAATQQSIEFFMPPKSEGT